MPIGPNDLPNDRTLVETVIQQIDSFLTDASFVRRERRGTSTDPWWMFVGSQELTESEKQEIINLYLAAGWGAVEVMNSSDNNERPGLWSVTLYKHRLIKLA